jgi:hypothetical protein
LAERPPIAELARTSADPTGVLNRAERLAQVLEDRALSALQNVSANIEKVRPHRDSENYSINVFDPDGNRWELSFVKGN